MSKKEIFARLFVDRGVAAVFLYRLSSWCYLHKLRFVAILLKQLNILINTCDIAYQAEIGKGLRIYHAIGTVITDCKIGEDFSIYQNSTIGGNGISDETGRSTPIIGNNCTFFTGSVVAGPIEIGNNVIVGANTVVLKDISSNHTVIGTSPKVKQRTI